MNWLLLGLFGGFVGTDATSFPQMMISRPFVAATLAGLLFGDPISGAVLGVFLEVFTLVVLPVGAARYPESGTAAAAAAAALVSAGGSYADTGLLLVAAAFALVWERVTGLTVILGRQINERLVANVAAAEDAQREVVRGHLLAVGFDYLRGAACVVTGAAIGRWLLQAIGPALGFGEATAAGILAIAASAVAGAGLLLFGGWRERRFVFAAGVVCGLLLTLIR